MFNSIKKLFNYFKRDTIYPNITWKELVSDKYPRNQAFSIPAFYQSVRLISEKIANCKCPLYEKEEDGNRRLAIEHPAYKLITKTPNNMISSWLFIRQQIINALSQGNSYAWIQRNTETYEPIALHLLDGCSVTPVVAIGLKELPTLYYNVTIGTDSDTVSADDVIHIRALTIDGMGLVGTSIQTLLKPTLDIATQTQDFAYAYFKNGGEFGTTVIEYPEAFRNAEQMESFRKSIEGLSTPGLKSFSPVILQSGAKLTKNSAANAETSQLIESRKTNGVEIATAFGLSAIKINSEINSGYGSVEAEGLSQLADLYEGILKQTENEFNLKLLRTDQQDSYYFEFDRSGLIKTSRAEEAETDIKLVQAGLMSFEEYRQKHNLPIVRNPQHQWYLPNNVTDINNKPAPQDPINKEQNGTSPNRE